MKKLQALATFNGRTSQEDPLLNNCWVVEINGFARFSFSKCSMPEGTTDVVEYREGGNNTTPRKSPGLTKFSDIVCERGVVLAAGSGDEDCMTWAKQVYDQTAKGPSSSGTFRRNIDIVKYNKEGKEARRYRVVECWPSKYKPGSDNDALASDNDIEVMTLTNEGWYLVKGAS